jgi:hypothetical protein
LHLLQSAVVLEGVPRALRSGGVTSCKERRGVAPALDGNDATRTPTVHVFYPEGRYTSVPDGAFLVDSFYYLKRSNGKTTEYFPKLLAELQRDTGLCFVAVCSGGAALAHPSGSGALYTELLARVPIGVRYLIPVICGNDFYAQSVRPVSAAVRNAVVAFGVQARARLCTTLAVVGMSAETWGYTRWMSEASARQYDDNCVEVALEFQELGVYAVRGSHELQNLKLADGIGHVHVDCERFIFDAIKGWVNVCVRTEAEALRARRGVEQDFSFTSLTATLVSSTATRRRLL